MAEGVRSTGTRATGVFAWLKANGYRVPRRRLRELAQLASATAWHEFASGQGPGAAQGSLRDLFKESAFSVHGLTRRSERYRARQRRLFGKELPYRSPRKGGMHMADLLRQPSSGFRAVALAGNERITTALRLPGARALNFMIGDKAVYREQFTGQRVPPQLSLRALKLFWTWLGQEIEGATDG